MFLIFEVNILKKDQIWKIIFSNSLLNLLDFIGKFWAQFSWIWDVSLEYLEAFNWKNFGAETSMVHFDEHWFQLIVLIFFLVLSLQIWCACCLGKWIIHSTRWWVPLGELFISILFNSMDSLVINPKERSTQ